MKKVVASVLVAAFLAAGCTGSFNLTKKVYNWHRSQTEKWTDELCFLLVAITPVYGFATFADAIVLNSIEFWTGKNPIEMSAVKGKENIKMTYNAKTEQVHVASLKGNGGMIFERSSSGVLAKNEKGEVLYSSVQNADGAVTIYDSKGNLVKDYPAGQIALLKEKYLQK
jgi:PBP1b-binding outer membrane lipoprotein LpoB